MIEKHPGIIISAHIYESLIDIGAGLASTEEQPQEPETPSKAEAGNLAADDDEDVPLLREPTRLAEEEGSSEPDSPSQSADSGSPIRKDDDPDDQGAQDAEILNVTPNREWSSRRHFQGMSPRELEFERRRSLQKTKSLGLGNRAIKVIPIVGIIGAVMALGYFILDSNNEQIIHSAVPIVPSDSAAPPSEGPNQNGDSILIPTVAPTAIPTAVPIIKPTVPIPTPTLTLNEIFELNKNGELSDEEAARELERRSLELANVIPTKIPLLVVNILPTPTPTLTPNPTPTPIEVASLYSRGSKDWITALENEIHRLVNNERQKNSLSLLSIDIFLVVVARGHSVDMALNNYFEHENLSGQDPTDRGNVLGYTCRKDYPGYYTIGIGENIFQGWLYSSFTRTSRNYMTIEEIAFQSVEGWMNSPGHRENILTKTYDREAIGVAIGSDESVYVTQNFC